jgi:hypothetical protein
MSGPCSRECLINKLGYKTWHSLTVVDLLVSMAWFTAYDNGSGAVYPEAMGSIENQGFKV